MDSIEALNELWHTEKCDNNCVKECTTCRKNKLFLQVKKDLQTLKKYQLFIKELKIYGKLPTMIQAVVDEFKKLNSEGR